MNGLLKLEIKILSLFRRLALLDIEGQKNSKKYNNILEDLKKKLKSEKEMLSKIYMLNITPEKLAGILNVARAIDEEIKARIGLLIITPTIENSAKKANNKSLEVADKIREETQANIFMFTIKLLKDLAMDAQYEKYKPQLISNFYEICYMEPNVSSRLIEDAFEIKGNFVKSSYLVGDLYNVDRKTTQLIVDEYCYDLLLNSVTRLFHNELFNNKNQNELNFLVLSCNIKAIEMTFSDIGLEKAKYEVLKIIEEENLVGHPNYEFLIKILFDPKHPREKVPTLTFGKPLK